MTSRKVLQLVTRFVWSKMLFSPRNVVRLVYCSELEVVHASIPRVHAHVFHYPDTICIVRDFDNLDDEHKIGILLHEFGHLFGGQHDADADLWVEQVLGIDIEYVDTMQWVPLEALA